MQESETKYVDISPHNSLMVKVGQTGYSLQEALAELVDNALDARQEKDVLRVDITIADDHITVTDSGVGMTEEQAINSIRLGFSDKTGKLGEFGLGLKSSATFLGNYFAINTVPNSDLNKSFHIEFNENEWLESGSWTHYPFTINKSDNPESGTTIIIKDLKLEIDDKSISKAEQELAARFTPFIAHNVLKLRVNGEICKAIEPEILGKRNYIEIEHDGIKVSGWWAYQLRGHDKNQFGLNTFRRGRLVTVFDKIGLNPNQDIKQIIGELNIEGVEISHHKRSWQTGSDNYKKLEKLLRKYFTKHEVRPRRVLSGYPVSGGLVEGKIKIVSMLMDSDLKEQTKDFEKGDILVTEMTRPQYLLLIRRASAIVTDLGGTLCHAAVVAREFDVPGVVGTKHGTSLLKDGQRVIVDGSKGIIYEI